MLLPYSSLRLLQAVLLLAPVCLVLGWQFSLLVRRFLGLGGGNSPDAGRSDAGRSDDGRSGGGSVRRTPSVASMLGEPLIERTGKDGNEEDNDDDDDDDASEANSEASSEVANEGRRGARPEPPSWRSHSVDISGGHPSSYARRGRGEGAAAAGAGEGESFSRSQERHSAFV